MVNFLGLVVVLMTASVKLLLVATWIGWSINVAMLAAAPFTGAYDGIYFRLAGLLIVPLGAFIGVTDASSWIG